MLIWCEGVVYYLRLDEFLRAQNPRDSPARQAESLGKAINNEDIIIVNVLDVFGG